MIWDILGHFGENCGSLPVLQLAFLRDISSFSIHFNSTLLTSDHQPSLAPNKTLKQNTWTTRFPIPAAASEERGEEGKAERYST